MGEFRLESEIPLLPSFLYLLDEAECDSYQNHPTCAKCWSAYQALCTIRFEDIVRRGV